eukprot:9181725-Pyramimonas_sp.AAC.1
MDQGKPVLEVKATAEAACMAIIDESYIVLTPWQIMQRYKKTAKTLRLKGIKLPNYQRKGDFTVFYPFKNPDQPYKILRLQSLVSAVASRAHKGNVPPVFEQQLPSVLKGMHRAVLTGTQTSALVRLPTLEDLDRRLARQDGLKTGDGDDDDDDAVPGGFDDDGGDFADDAEGEESEEEGRDHGDEPGDPDDQMLSSTRKKPAARRVDDDGEPENVVPRRSPTPGSKMPRTPSSTEFKRSGSSGLGLKLPPSIEDTHIDMSIEKGTP